jgi:hypothetical protein
MRATMEKEEKQNRIQKSKIANKKRINLMTIEERKEKYGWLNKLTLEEKRYYIENVLTQTGSHAWWKNASEEDKTVVRNKISETAVRRRLSNINLYKEFKLYRNAVDLLTQKTYKKYRKQINPDLLPRRSGNKGYHLDHKYSVYQGFVDGLPVEIISSKYNLHMLPGSTNLSKSEKCCITKEELLMLYEQEKNTKI